MAGSGFRVPSRPAHSAVLWEDVSLAVPGICRLPYPLSEPHSELTILILEMFSNAQPTLSLLGMFQLHLSLLPWDSWSKMITCFFARVGKRDPNAGYSYVHG